jgi:NADH:ubiquinone oxidoreductase subunit 6 (subunit J)
MGIAPLAFYLFAATVVVSGFLVVVAKNPVHAVLWLILAFFSTAGLFVLMGAEFVAMLLVIVYVGAVDGAVPVRGDDARTSISPSCGRRVHRSMLPHRCG